MKTLQVSIRGTAPLLMNNVQMSDPLNPLVKELQKYTKKTKKTEDDHMQIQYIHWRGSLYMHQEKGPVVPGLNVEAMIRDAAKTKKKGKAVTAAVIVEPDFIPVEYNGPRDVDGMWDASKDFTLPSQKFRDTRSVKPQMNRIMMSRARFDIWTLTFMVKFDESIFDKQELIDIIQYAGDFIGVCDYRPKYGRFAILEIKEVK